METGRDAGHGVNTFPTQESFARRLHSKFAIRADASRSFALELIDVKGHAAPPTYEAFSLMFRAPVDVPAEQGTYRLEHESLDAMDVFLVPVKRDDGGLYFEAVFNYWLAGS